MKKVIVKREVTIREILVKLCHLNGNKVLLLEDMRIEVPAHQESLEKQVPSMFKPQSQQHRQQELCFVPCLWWWLSP